MTKHDEIRFTAEEAELRWDSKGDGQGTRRYRFFPGKGLADFDEGGELVTCYGVSDAVTWLRGYKTALQLTRTQETRATIDYLSIECDRWPGPEAPRSFVEKVVAGVEEGKHRRGRLLLEPPAS